MDLSNYRLCYAFILSNLGYCYLGYMTYMCIGVLYVGTF